MSHLFAFRLILNELKHKALQVVVALVVILVVVLEPPEYCFALEEAPPIPVPQDVLSIGQLLCEDGRLYCSMRSANFGLYCFDTHTNSEQWRVSLGQDFNQEQLVPNAMCLSQDRATLYIATKPSRRLVACDVHSGTIGQTTELTELFTYLFTASIGPLHALIAVSDAGCSVYDSSDLNNMLYSDAFQGYEISDAVYDADTQRLFVTLPYEDLLLAYEFVWSDALEVDFSSVNTGSYPFSCIPIDNQMLAVCCSESSNIWLYSITSLQLYGTPLPGLTHLANTVYSEGLLFLLLLYSAEAQRMAGRDKIC
jgi:hypothetical protein